MHKQLSMLMTRSVFLFHNVIKFKHTSQPEKCSVRAAERILVNPQLLKGRQKLNLDTY